MPSWSEKAPNHRKDVSTGMEKENIAKDNALYGTRIMPRLNSGVALIILIISIVVVSAIIIGALNSADRITDALDEEGNLHILMTLEDNTELVSSQLLVYNVRTKRAALLDLPTYLGVIIDEDNSLDRIDRLYNSGFLQEYQMEVENFAQTAIDFHIRFFVSRIEQLVDLLGGIRLFVLDDFSDDQQLPSGDVVYDGRKALEYTTIVAALDDEDNRSERLQSFMVRVLLTVANKAQFITHPDVMRYFQDYIQSDARRRDLRNFLFRLNSVEDELMSVWTTQGDLRGVLIDNQRELLLFPTSAWIETTVNQISIFVSGESDAQVENRGIRIEILNGTTTGGLARRTKLLFEQYGFEVVRIGNYEDADIEQTLILNRSRATNYTRSVAEVINATNIVNLPLVENPDVIDVTIVLGADFDGVVIQ